MSMYVYATPVATSVGSSKRKRPFGKPRQKRIHLTQDMVQWLVHVNTITSLQVK